MLFVLIFLFTPVADVPVDVSTPAVYYQEQNDKFNVQASTNTPRDRIDALIDLMKLRGIL